MSWPRWLAALVTVVGLLAGCTGGEVPRPTRTPTVAAVAPSDTNPQPRARVAEGGMLRVPLTALPVAWNPWHPSGASPEASAVRAPLSAAAFTFDPAGRPAANPDYVTEATVTHSERTRVVLTLNPRAVWSDGAPITAADWIATWQALRGTAPGYQVTDDQGWRGVADVREGASAHEVVIDYAGIQPDWTRPLAAGPARADSVRDADTFNGAWSDYRAGWFSGPFIVGHIDKAQGVITLDPNPLWWGETPRLAHIAFRTIQPEAVAAAFQHNEFDVLPVTTAARLAQVRAAADTTVRSAPAPEGRLLRVNTAGVLGDPALRGALLRALDRAAVARANVDGTTGSPLVWSNSLLLTNHPGYIDEAVATGLGHDRTAAADALTKAGWPLVDGYRARDGRPLVLTMSVPTGDAAARREFDAIQTTLADLGVTLSEATDAPDLTPATVRFDRYPLAGVREHADADVADLAGRVSVEVDAVRRADLSAQLARRLWERADAIPLYQPLQLVAVRNGLANLGPNGFGSTRWEDVGWAR